MQTYKIIFIGDIFGKPGRKVVERILPDLKEKHQPLFTIVNGENAASGKGITSAIADHLFSIGVDGITLGNHAFAKKEIYSYLDEGNYIIRPNNIPAMAPGKGFMDITKDGIKLYVINLCGRIFMNLYDDPFANIDSILSNTDSKHILLDFHGEATSEKVTMGWYLDGKVTAVLGTHTHVQTADERVLPKGTAYISDVGMTGPRDGVIGVDRFINIQRFKTGLPAAFEVASGDSQLSGVVIEVDKASGKALSIERILWSGEHSEI